MSAHDITTVRNTLTTISTLIQSGKIVEAKKELMEYREKAIVLGVFDRETFARLTIACIQ